MSEENFIWECECGYIEHSDLVPEDCPECLRIGAFSKIPEEMAAEKEEEAALSIKPEEEEDEEEDED